MRGKESFLDLLCSFKRDGSFQAKISEVRPSEKASDTLQAGAFGSYRCHQTVFPKAPGWVPLSSLQLGAHSGHIPSISWQPTSRTQTHT